MQPSKALSLIILTELGIITSVKFLQPLKASFPILSTDSGIENTPEGATEAAVSSSPTIPHSFKRLLYPIKLVKTPPTYGLNLKTISLSVVLFVNIS